MNSFLPFTAGVVLKNKIYYAVHESFCLSSGVNEQVNLLKWKIKTINNAAE